MKDSELIEIIEEIEASVKFYEADKPEFSTALQAVLRLLKVSVEGMPDLSPFSPTLCQNRNRLDYCGTCEQAWDLCSCSARNNGFNSALAKCKPLFQKLTLRIKELETVLGAWHNIFGTTQLTHAHSRLESAEDKVTALTKRVKERDDELKAYSRTVAELFEQNAALTKRLGGDA